MKNFINTLIGVIVAIFVADTMITKYNLDPNEPTCINHDVQELLLKSSTEEVVSSMLNNGFVLDVRLLKETITTDEREFTYRGNSKYLCGATLEFSLSAKQGSKETEKIISLIDSDYLTDTIDIDYGVKENDLGTTFYIGTKRINYLDVEILFTTELELAKSKIKKEMEKKLEEKLEKEVTEKAKKIKLEACYSALTSADNGIKDVEKLYKGEPINGRVDTEADNNVMFALQSLEVMGYRIEGAEKKCAIGTKEQKDKLLSIKSSLSAFMSQLKKEETLLREKAGTNSIGMHLISKDDFWTQISLVGENERCGISLKFNGDLQFNGNECVSLVNSNNVSIICTAAKSICKTEQEILEFSQIK